MKFIHIGKNYLDLVSIENILKLIASLRLILNMSQTDRLLSEARVTAEESTQDESDFIEVRNNRDRFRKQVPNPVNNERPMIVSIDPRPSQIQFAKAIKSHFPAVKIKKIRELKNKIDFLIQPEEFASSECLMLSLNLNQAFPNSKENARNRLPKPKSRPSFVIANVYHSLTEDEVKEDFLNNNGRNVNKGVKNNKLSNWPTNKNNTCDYGIKQSSHCSAKTWSEKRLAATPM